ncbi:MAG: hypothetical protein QXE01_11265 [Sulfolobales archaeon]
MSEKILLYNDGCAICYRMARYTWKITRGRIKILGMFSDSASQYREAILRMLGNNEDLYSSMPWLIDGRKVMGGISIIAPIFFEAFKSLFRPGKNIFRDPMPMRCEPIAVGRGIRNRISYGLEIIVRMLIQSYRSILTKRYKGYLPEPINT